MNDWIKYVLLGISALLLIAVLGMVWGITHAIITAIRNRRMDLDSAIEQKPPVPTPKEPVKLKDFIEILKTPAAQEGADKYTRE